MVFKCKICNREFNLASGLFRHVSKSHGKSPEEYYLQVNNLSEPAKCKICGNPVKFINGIKGYRTFCSTECEMKDPGVISKSKATNMSRYGSENPMSTDIVKRKIAATNKDRYGVEYPVMNKEIRDRGIQTCIDRYGVDNPLKCPEIKERAVKACLDKFGVNTPFESKEIREKAVKSVIQNYGVDNVFKSDSVKRKIAETNISRYGVAKTFCSKSIQEKCRQTFNAKYNGNSPMVDPEVRAKTRKRYTYEGLQFDSSWEVAFYIFHKDAGHDIVLHPRHGFEYYHNDKRHWYFPDFIVNGKYYEIKGSQFFDGTGNLVNPFDPSINEQWKYKLQCMKDNNIAIITDCTEFIRYVCLTYGKEYIRSFRNS